MSGHHGLMDVATKIEMEVRAAFPAKREAPFHLVAGTSLQQEPLLTAEAFGDKEDWTTLTADWLDEAPDGWATALFYLSDEAARFYVPAYIVADLRGDLKRVELDWHLTHGFDETLCDNSGVNWAEHSRRKWSKLSAAQALSVTHYLEWVISQDSIGLPHGIEAALSRFWYRHPALN